jgi:mannonate dehydratase
MPDLTTVVGQGPSVEEEASEPSSSALKRARNRYDFLIRSPLFEPENLDLHIGPEALALVTGALGRLQGTPVIDYHCHLAGVGNGSACCGPPGVVPLCKRRECGLGFGFNRAKSAVFMSAFGVMEHQQDVEAADRIARLVKEVPADLKCVLLAFDKRYDRESGAALPEATPLYVPNEYTHAVAQSAPSSFLAACSVHPYRLDAVEELERCRAR